VEQVNFLDCFQTLARLALCLPTEAQWEYACRGGTQTRWWTGSEESTLEGAANLADKAAVRWGASWPWLKNRTLWDDGYGPHAPVGSFRANPFGLHDVHGNVFEWCLDPYAPYEDPLRGGDGLRLRSQVWLNYVSHRVTRGGAYQDMPRYLRSSMHHGVNRTVRSPTTGVRPARRLDRP
jgi:formylglycine-generating enzyme required for sulfatase activity